MMCFFENNPLVFCNHLLLTLNLDIFKTQISHFSKSKCQIRVRIWDFIKLGFHSTFTPTLTIPAWVDTNFTFFKNRMSHSSFTVFLKKTIKVELKPNLDRSSLGKHKFLIFQNRNVIFEFKPGMIKMFSDPNLAEVL